MATVYRKTILPLTNMAAIRWLKISEALAELGFHVDMIADTGNGNRPLVLGRGCAT